MIKCDRKRRRQALVQQQLARQEMRDRARERERKTERERESGEALCSWKQTDTLYGQRKAI